MKTLIDTSIAFATKFHEGQVRKYTGEPYVTHPMAVAELFKESFIDLCTDEAYIAAILHDCVEDTECTYDDIIETFGETVASYVWFLTKPETFVGNRKLRKALDVARLNEAPEVVKAIKLCDLIHNSTSIQEHDPKFWESFKEESLQLISIDTGAGFTRTAAIYSELDFFLHEYSDFVESIQA